jgi:hypothetical protein
VEAGGSVAAGGSVEAGGSVAGSDVAGADVAGAEVAGALGAQAETIRTKSVIRLKAKYLFDMVVSPLTWLVEYESKFSGFISLGYQAFSSSLLLFIEMEYILDIFSIHQNYFFII